MWIASTVDLSEELELDESKIRDMDAVVDRFVVTRSHEKQIKASVLGALLVGDGLMEVHVVKGATKTESERALKGVVSPATQLRLWRHSAGLLHVQ